MRTVKILLASWGCMFLGGWALGVSDPNAQPVFHTESINWDAISAMASIAGALALLNWFVIRQAVASSVLLSELKFRVELGKYMTTDRCKAMHGDTRRRVDVLEDHEEDDRRLDALEDRG